MTQDEEIDVEINLGGLLEIGRTLEDAFAEVRTVLQSIPDAFDWVAPDLGVSGEQAEEIKRAVMLQWATYGLQQAKAARRHRGAGGRAAARKREARRSGWRCQAESEARRLYAMSSNLTRDDVADRVHKLLTKREFVVERSTVLKALPPRR